MNTWTAVLATGLGCLTLKLVGLAAPQKLLADPRAQRFAELVPVALLSALVLVQAFAHGRALEADWPRLAGLAAAVVALLFRAPFLAVLALGATVAAGLRLIGLG